MLTLGNAIVKIIDIRNADFFSVFIISKGFSSSFLCLLFLLANSCFLFSKIIIIPSKKFFKKDGKLCWYCFKESGFSSSCFFSHTSSLDFNINLPKVFPAIIDVSDVK